MAEGGGPRAATHQRRHAIALYRYARTRRCNPPAFARVAAPLRSCARAALPGLNRHTAVNATCASAVQREGLRQVLAEALEVLEEVLQALQAGEEEGEEEEGEEGGEGGDGEEEEVAVLRAPVRYLGPFATYIRP
eukprot:4632438-Prymnesium_polylepis.1